MIRFLIVAVVAGLSTFGCDEDSDLFNDRATVHFHNKLTQSSGGDRNDVRVDLRVDNQTLLSQRPYTQNDRVSGQRVELDEQEQSLAIDVLGRAGSTLINGPVNKRLRANQAYTLVLMGDTTLDNRRLESFRQIPMALPASQIRIRFIHTLSQEADDELRLFLDDDPFAEPLVDSLRYGQASSYRTLTAGSQISVQVDNLVSEERIGEASCPISGGQTIDAILSYQDFDSERTEIKLFCQTVE